MPATAVWVNPPPAHRIRITYARGMKRGWLIAIAGCGGSASHPATKPVAGPPYRALFEPGKPWTLPIERRAGHYGQQKYAVDKREHGTLRCRGERPQTLGDIKVIHLACDPPDADLLITGPWLATPRGLQHPFADPAPDELARVASADPMLAATPEERHDADQGEESATSSEAFAFGAGWCVRESHAAEADRRDFTLCLDAAGLAGGNELVITGPNEDWTGARFGNAPPDPDDHTEP